MWTFDIAGGTVYGTATIFDNGTVFVYLNAAGLFAISAAQGGTFSLGGVDSGESRRRPGMLLRLGLATTALLQ